MGTGTYDRDILSELQSIDNRLSNLYTEVQTMHEDQITHHEELITTLKDGFTFLTAIIILAATVKVLFRNA